MDLNSQLYPMIQRYPGHRLTVAQAEWTKNANILAISQKFANSVCHLTYCIWIQKDIQKWSLNHPKTYILEKLVVQYFTRTFKQFFFKSHNPLSICLIFPSPFCDNQRQRFTKNLKVISKFNVISNSSTLRLKRCAGIALKLTLISPAL